MTNRKRWAPVTSTLTALATTAACAGGPSQPTSSPAFVGTLAYNTSTLDTLRIEQDGRVAHHAAPAVDVSRVYLRSLQVHPSKRWLLALAGDGKTWSSVRAIPLGADGVPDLAHWSAQSLEPVANQADVLPPYGSRARFGLLSVAFSTTGDLVYVGRARFLGSLRDCHGPGALTVHAFDVATGILGPGSAPATVPTDPVALLPDPDGFLYAVGMSDETGLGGPCGAGGLTGDVLAGAGTPAPLPGSPFERDVTVTGIAMAGGHVLVHQYDFPGHVVTTAGIPSLFVHPRLATWARRADGVLVRGDTIEFGENNARNFGGSALHPSGRLFYLWHDGYVEGYSFDAGAVRQLPGSRIAQATSGQLAITPDGRFLYSFQAATIVGYHIDAATGALEPLAGSPFGIQTPLYTTWLLAAYP